MIKGLSYSLKTKCQGCLALKTTGTGFECKLGVPITFEHMVIPHTSGKGTGTGPSNNSYPIKPRPIKKCYKPKDVIELKEAKQKIALDIKTGRRNEA